MTAQDQQSRAAELRATIDMLDECAKAGKPWPYVPSTESIRAVLDELAAAQVLAMGRVPPAVLMTHDELTEIWTQWQETEGTSFAALIRLVESRVLAAAPRPPAAQERKPLTDEQIEQATGAKRGEPLFLVAKGFTVDIEAAHGIVHPKGD